ncbi:hypothetical protein [Plantactinospora sp. CA-290183]|uniref:hypothetical protein n=1 Tax=Plantactinospora sp. CA-290183 TaxID=3240006 RepID=UPI003D94E569
MSRQLWFHLNKVLEMAEIAATSDHRIDLDENVVPETPPALYLMRDCSGDRYLDDRLYIDGNFHPSLNEYAVDAEPLRTAHGGRRYGGITWTEWLGGPPRGPVPVQAQIRLLDDSRLLDQLRAGFTAGCEVFAIDIAADGRLSACVIRRHRRRDPHDRRVAAVNVHHE